MKVLNLGSLNIDYVYQVEHMVLEGETQAASALDICCGGKGLNQSIALAKAGAEVYHAGLAGEDGEMLRDTLRRNRVHTEYVRLIPGRSGHTIIQVDRRGSNCILLYGGANRQLTKAYIDEVLAHFEKDDILVLQNEVNHLAYIIRQAAGKGMKVILNPSPCDDHLKECDLSTVSMMLLNETEGWQITGEKDPDRILGVLRGRYPGMEVILTLGQQGSLYQKDGLLLRQGIFPAKTVDTTAAGDTFTGYYIAARSEGVGVPEALRLAAKAASIAVSRKGASASIPEKWEVFDDAGCR